MPLWLWGVRNSLIYGRWIACRHAERRSGAEVRQRGVFMIDPDAWNQCVACEVFLDASRWPVTTPMTSYHTREGA
jgi:hypothetical protein